jgi:hypothetical protein
MVAISISEFTFGYAFLYEQTRRNWQNLTAAPVLPSLRREADEGWDAHLPVLGIDYYYQFKISDYLYYRNANYIRYGPYNGPYYRFALHKRNFNQQHRRLKAHARTHPYTYYVAPEINDIDVFNNAFLSGSLTDRSRLIPLTDCRDLDVLDNEQHYITYPEGLLDWNEHSESIHHDRSYSGKELERLYRATSNEWKHIDLEFTMSLLEKTKKDIGILIPKRLV